MGQQQLRGVPFSHSSILPICHAPFALHITAILFCSTGCLGTPLASAAVGAAQQPEAELAAPQEEAITLPKRSSQDAAGAFNLEMLAKLSSSKRVCGEKNVQKVQKTSAALLSAEALEADGRKDGSYDSAGCLPPTVEAEAAPKPKPSLDLTASAWVPSVATPVTVSTAPLPRAPRATESAFGWESRMSS